MLFFLMNAVLALKMIPECLGFDPKCPPTTRKELMLPISSENLRKLYESILGRLASVKEMLDQC